MSGGIYYTVTQAVCAAAIAVSLFVFISRSRRVILAAKLTDDVLWMTYYFMIGA